MYNKVILVGNLTRDIEIRYTPGGSAVANTGIATNRRYKTAAGEQKDETMFIDITFFGRTAEIANQYLRKGSKVLVEGRLKLDQWTAQDGTKRSRHTITVENLQMLDSKGDAPAAVTNPGYAAPSHDAYAQPSQPAPQPTPQSQQPEPAQTIPEIDIDEDEIPF